MIRFAVAAAALAVVAGCSIDPKTYETEPVTIDTPRGKVVCQLYTKELVTWDRAIDRPARMSIAEADAICRAEGQRQKTR
ncbi:hypothetical protein SAMN05878503_10877 [Cereibacter ovatus]|uniref:Lipoprotein n=1 Tax=Cereibacter ovatus TaxID=439529 RepID=A0A285CUC6_9RHOB|nr:hypothetical protein [Cereibacter ovatus]SNX71124.1 hypothetical protein SAMN05878503_10877 [Cereibacter ovatus]